MKNEGKLFENDFAKSFKDIFILRLKDSASGWNNGNMSRFTVNNPCDFISINIYNNKVLLLELKSFNGKSCPFSNFKKHQIDELNEYALKFDHTQCYFILNFRELDVTYAVRATDIYKIYIDKEGRKSVSIKFCEENGIKIKQEKKE